MFTAEFGRSILPELENKIPRYHNILSSSPRSDPLRPTRLRYLAMLRTIRYDLLGQEEDLNQCITHITEAILLPHGPSQSSQDVVCGFSMLISCLLSRFALYKRPDDIESSLKYIRHLRGKFHPFEASPLPSNRLALNHVRALSYHVALSNDVEEMEEMADLCHELLTLDDGNTREAIFDFSIATVEVFRRGDAKQPPERVIDVLRVAATRKPDWHHVSFALAHCLAIHFEMTHDINFYEEAMTIADSIIASRNPEDSLSPTQTRAIELVTTLITDLLNFLAKPEYLMNSTRRLQKILHDIPSLSKQLSLSITELLGRLRQRRHDYFGVTKNSAKTRFNPPVADRRSSFPSTRPVFRRSVEPADNAGSETGKRVLLRESLVAIRSNGPADIEETVKYGRILIPSPHSSRRSLIAPVNDLAEFLFEAYRRNSRLDHLNEAIVTFRRVLRVPGTDRIRFQAAERLLIAIDERWRLFHGMQDLEEAMSLLPELVTSGSEAPFHRFPFSCKWASKARAHALPCTSDAYESAMSLMQETLVFSPTLQTQHSLLAATLREFEGIPLDYASYQIEMTKPEQAVETLERGRTLLWSEMRGFRTSTDQLFADEPVLAHKFTQINEDLEQVTMSVLRNEGMEFVDDGIDGDEGIDALNRLVLRQRELLKKRRSLISDIQTLPYFGNFLKPPSFDSLNQAASCGPVIIINQSSWRSDILILLEDSPSSVISTPPDFHNRAKGLKDRLLGSRSHYGLGSDEYELTLASVLAELYTFIGKSVIDKLHELKIPEQSRVWWCPTAAFCSLPLHAMGPVPSDDGELRYFMDLYITSYTTSLSALIESRKHRSRAEKVDKPPTLLVALPDSSPPVVRVEADFVQGLPIPVTSLIGVEAEPTNVMEGLRKHRFVHIACRGRLETGKPFDASFELYGKDVTLLEIVRSRLPAAEFAFLSACHTAALTQGSLDDEGLHLTAAMQYCGFRSVIGTLWAMVDEDGAPIAKYVYRSMFLDSPNLGGAPYHERSAKALQYAVKKLRRSRWITLERWVNFVHYGA